MRLGVVIGRFQIDALHDGHKRLLDHARTNSDQVLVLIGCSALYGTKRNPLDYSARELMVCNYLAEATSVLPLQDMREDADWSRQVDGLIQAVYPMAKEVTLYHGRDSFRAHYSGRYKLGEVDVSPTACASDVRKQISCGFPHNADQRRGAIWAREHTFGGVKMAVDIVVTEGIHFLLGRKPGSKVWQFPGGFVDPADKSLEHAAARELMEECNAEVAHDALEYVGSTSVDDWRLRGLTDAGITTALFKVSDGAVQTEMKAGDDLEEIRYFDQWELEEALSPTHQPLWAMLK